MPNIPTYTSQVRPARPNAAQASAAANIGEARAAGFRAIGETIKDTTSFIDAQQGQRETSRLTKEGAEFTAGLAKSWDEYLKAGDPNNPNLAEEWTEKHLNPALDKFGEDAWSTAGQQLRDNYTSRLRAHFFERTTADEMALAGATVQTNLEQSANIYAAGARVDPSSMQMSIDMFRDGFEEQLRTHPNLSAIEVAKLRSDVLDKATRGIALAAALGKADKNPEATKQELAKGKDSEWGKYLDVSDFERVTEAITESENAFERKKNQLEADARQAKQDAADEARTEWTRKLVLDPTKVDPKVIANDPRLSGEQIQVITNFQDEELRKLKAGTSDEEGGKSPAFWRSYDQVFKGAFKSTDDIYALARKGGPLTLPEADKLVSLWKGRREGAKVGNYQDDRARTFFSTMHDNFLAATGGGTNNTVAEGAWNRFFYEKSNMLDNRGDKTVDQLIDEKSPDYIGKNWKDYLPKEVFENDDVVPLTPAKPTGIWDYLGSFFSGGAVFDLKEFDSKFQDGEAGGAQGFAALTAASRAGAISPEAALEYAKKRGWVRANAPKQQVAPAMK